MSKQRIARLRRKLKKLGAEALVLKSEPNLRYFCGFTGTSGLLWIDRDCACFMTDSRYTEQARNQVTGAEVEQHNGFIDGLKKLAGSARAKKIAFEGEGFTYAEVAAFTDKLNIEAIPANGLGSERACKSADEIKKLRRAVQIAEASFDLLLAAAASGKSERELAVIFETSCRAAGSKIDAFNTSSPAATGGPCLTG